MADPRDETLLNAFVDGQTSPAETLAILRAAREDPELAARIDAMREDAALVAAAFAQELEEERPSASLERMIRERSAQARRPRRPRLALPAAAAAAVVAAAIGLGAFYADMRIDRRIAELAAAQEESQALLASAVQDALERRRSGETVSLTAGRARAAVSVTPVKTYKSKTGHWCREFEEVVRDDRGELRRRGVACRVKTGEWRRVKTVIDGEDGARRI